MGKRSTFDRIPRDCYDTPPKGVPPLLVHLPARFQFVEPCAGQGALVDSLVAAGGECVGAFDIEPRRQGIERRDAMTLTAADVPPGALIITNPPHSRHLLHPLIAHFISLLDRTWMLIDSDWKENQRSAELVGHLRAYQPIGRLVWMPGTKKNGKDNHGWYLFGQARSKGYRGYPRIPRPEKNQKSVPAGEPESPKSVPAGEPDHAFH